MAARQKRYALLLFVRSRRLLSSFSLLSLSIFLLSLNIPCVALNRLRRDEEEKMDNEYMIGIASRDMTGPAAQVNFMGYAKGTQMGHGIHLRLRSRAFIIAQKPQQQEERFQQEQPPQEDPLFEDENERNDYKKKRHWLRWGTDDNQLQQGDAISQNLDPDNAICFVSVDIGMGSDLMTKLVIDKLNETLDYNLCTIENTSISGTHTHSAPAGFLQYTLYQVTSLGYSNEVMDAYVTGIVESLVHAHNNLQLGHITKTDDLLQSANINRSPTSYLLNPIEERNEYISEGGDTDKRMYQLNFYKQQSTSRIHDNGADNENNNLSNSIGILNWFSVHGTSMNSSNLLISGDNKGYASYIMERTMNGNETITGKGKFVAAFASTNLGDVSPNTAGPRCVATGKPCDVLTSTCDDEIGDICVASGPGKNHYESTRIIGEYQYQKAMELLISPTSNESKHTPINGPIKFRHAFINMAGRNVTLENNTIAQTCPAALGYSFAAGTTDGFGAFPFVQGTNTSNLFWNEIGGYLSRPDKAQIKCQAPKPILLNTGQANLPYSWDPDSVPISIFQIGYNFYILNVPGEFTTMAGRRLRKAVANILPKEYNATIVIAGLANSYTHYITTFEEYQGQRYEAASTMYGPHTLTAYIQAFEKLTIDLVNDTHNFESDDPPDDLQDKQWSFIPPVQPDLIGWGYEFGSVAVPPKESYTRGIDTVFVSFRSANPRNNVRLEDTFLTVDYWGENDKTWKTIYVDGDWCTKYYWKNGVADSTEIGSGISFAEITWEIPADTKPGPYRICHYGTRKTWFGNMEAWFYHFPPDWWLFGNSAALGVLVESIRYASAFLKPVHLLLHEWLQWTKYSDFEGCSPIFMVHI